MRCAAYDDMRLVSSCHVCEAVYLYELWHVVLYLGGEQLCVHLAIRRQRQVCIRDSVVTTSGGVWFARWGRRVCAGARLGQRARLAVCVVDNMVCVARNKGV